MLDEMNYMQEPEDSPRGRHLGVGAIISMIIQRIVGSGIFAVPSLIYRDVGGSPFLFFLVWGLSAFMSFAGFYCFLELGCIIPRSGGLKVFLEYIYFKPKMCMSVVFNTYSVIFGFTITNAIIFGEYFLSSLGYDDLNNMTPKYIGCVFVVVVCIIHGFSTRFGVALANITGYIKLFLLVCMSLSGIYILVFPSSITGIPNNLHLDGFFATKRPITLASFISALMKGIFSLGGWQSAHVVANEVKDPIRTMRIAGPLALLIINVCYFFINVSYLVVIPSEELFGTGELVGSLLFEKIFGYAIGRRFLTMTVALSSAGNIITVLFHISRMNQEIFREGFLPFSRFFASNWPCGAPLRALLFPLVISSFFLLIPTPDNVYDYIINIEGYPLQIFCGMASAGVYIIRYRRPDLNPEIKAHPIHIIFMTLFSLFLFIGPLNPFKKTEFEGFPNYAYAALTILFACWLYWLIKFRIMPHFGKYELTQSTDVLSDGLVVKRWEKSEFPYVQNDTGP
ncbi:hypothetical protein CANARDRAFT_174326 [[Candida] arabinofermentans NRRL YB-2248]|uniref:Amino acid permease/ SLC12A domain-containing protein n=1 Tax=[Candida] arabinofermentans NRRL YB-2248 TaxID=983967 RepID=A0A1E4T687_9ASCO|nr:hypothetical protein CANARDRAFT_174326 [[Candida] arabinofermentans NRRL YB-2248]